jgi:hypothetical protein
MALLGMASESSLARSEWRVKRAPAREPGPVSIRHCSCALLLLFGAGLTGGIICVAAGGLHCGSMES